MPEVSKFYCTPPRTLQISQLIKHLRNLIPNKSLDKLTNIHVTEQVHKRTD
jgi:hypothetical protein